MAGLESSSYQQKRRQRAENELSGLGEETPVWAEQWRHPQQREGWVLQELVMPQEEKWIPGTPLAVQWLGLGAFTAEGLGSTPGQGTKILQAARCGPLPASPPPHKKKKERKKRKMDPERRFWEQPVSPTRSLVLCLSGFLNSPLVIADPCLNATLCMLRKTYLRRTFNYS